MGVDFRIVLYSSSKAEAELAAGKAFARIEELNNIMSDYKVDSEIWKLSESSGKNMASKVSDEMWHILKESLRINQLSHGAFDVSAGPYIQLWRKARWNKKVPAQRLRERAAVKVGMHNLEFNDVERTVLLKQTFMRLDLGGIAKGYAADEALKVLVQNGVEFAIVDGSGDMAMTDHPSENWKVFVADDKQKTSEYIFLNKGAIATSGDTTQFVEIAGKRYSHIVDPRTGLGVTNRCRVTVVAPNCQLADSLASAVTVMGPERGLELVESLSDVEVYIEQRLDSQMKVLKSSGFPDLIKSK